MCRNVFKIVVKKRGNTKTCVYWKSNNEVGHWSWNRGNWNKDRNKKMDKDKNEKDMDKNINTDKNKNIDKRVKLRI